jgi:hypothetical protein
MTHPPNVCAHCENGRDPVTRRNGYSFNFQIADSVVVEICLHIGCADDWCRAFNIPFMSQPAIRRNRRQIRATNFLPGGTILLD